MSACKVCGTDLLEDAKACHVCGSSVDDVLSGAAEPVPTPEKTELVRMPAASGRRRCPACSERYDDSYRDSFCTCGAALVADEPTADEAPDVDLKPAGPAKLDLVPVTPLAGVARLVIYSAERQPIHTFALDRDVTRVGRDDAVRGDFVDLDVGRLFDAATARKVSRKHCLVLRSRETQSFVLRPLAGNTGTQVGGELAAELSDYPLSDGTRIVLGGAVRMKFVTS
jgi:hypothetical protein